MTGGVSEAAKVVRALRAAHLHDGGRPALLQMACERIRSWGPPYTSVYAYMMHGDELQPVAEKRDQNVADVNAVGGGNYIACNAFTKSELVVLIRRGDHILGQLDIDSDVRAGFGEREHADVKEVADALAVLL